VTANCGDKAVHASPVLPISFSVWTEQIRWPLHILANQYPGSSELTVAGESERQRRRRLVSHSPLQGSSTPPLFRSPTTTRTRYVSHCTAPVLYHRPWPLVYGHHVSAAAVARLCSLALLWQQPQFPRTNGAFELNPTSAETNTTNTPPALLLGHLLAFRKLVPLSRSFASLLLGCSRLSKRYVHFLAALYSNAQTNSVAAKPPPHRESSTGLQRRLLLRDHQGKPTLARLCSATDLLTVPRNRFL
jgi:hypothetical protein